MFDKGSYGQKEDMQTQVKDGASMLIALIYHGTHIGIRELPNLVLSPVNSQ